MTPNNSAKINSITMLEIMHTLYPDTISFGLRKIIEDILFMKTASESAHRKQKTDIYLSFSKCF